MFHDARSRPVAKPLKLQSGANTLAKKSTPAKHVEDDWGNDDWGSLESPSASFSSVSKTGNEPPPPPPTGPSRNDGWGDDFAADHDNAGGWGSFDAPPPLAAKTKAGFGALGLGKSTAVAPSGVKPAAALPSTPAPLATPAPATTAATASSGWDDSGWGDDADETGEDDSASAAAKKRAARRAAAASRLKGKGGAGKSE